MSAPAAKPAAVFDARGRRLGVGPRIGGGGEGEVYEVHGRPDRAVKLYHDKYRAPRRAKIAAMIARRLCDRSDLVAFPTEAVSSDRGEFLGFAMRRVVGHRPLFQLYVPRDRARYFPAADPRFLVRAAANVARAVASVHYAGCVVGDLNESGLLVSSQATVAMIDADSFQVAHGADRFLCGVGKPDYTAPELRGLDFARDARSRNHDAFALASLIFQLLFLGRLPFAGRMTGADVDLDKAIGEHRFAFSRVRDTGLGPPPGAATLADVSLELAAAFESAFAPVGSVGLRPKALEWVDLLQRFEDELTPCPRTTRHLRHRDAGACGWCRIARETKADPF